LPHLTRLLSNLPLEDQVVFGLLDQREIGFRENLHELRVRLTAFDDNKASSLEGFRGTECNTGQQLWLIDLDTEATNVIDPFFLSECDPCTPPGFSLADLMPRRGYYPTARGDENGGSRCSR
jgi:hypothetical protein